MKYSIFLIILSILFSCSKNDQSSNRDEIDIQSLYGSWETNTYVNIDTIVLDSFNFPERIAIFTFDESGFYTVENEHPFSFHATNGEYLFNESTKLLTFIAQNSIITPRLTWIIKEISGTKGLVDEFNNDNFIRERILTKIE